MQREIKIQIGIIEYLKNSTSIDEEDISTLLQLQNNDNKGNLNL